MILFKTWNVLNTLYAVVVWNEQAIFLNQNKLLNKLKGSRSIKREVWKEVQISSKFPKYSPNLFCFTLY